MSEPVTRRYPSDTARAPSGNRKKLMLYGAGGLAVLGVYFFVIRPRSKTAATDTTDTADVSGVDSSLGYADSGGYGDGSGMGYSTYYPPVGGTTVGIVPTTNQQWVQAAVGYLAGQGYNPVAVLSALGEYIASPNKSIAVDEHQLHIIQAAIAAEGYPPIKPPDPHLQPSSGQTQQTKRVPTPRAGTIHEVAKMFNMELRAFVRLNPMIAAKYLNTGKQIPKGTLVTVYK